MSKLVHMSSFFCTKCSQQGEQGRQEAGSVQEVYLRWARGKDVLAAGEQEESGPGHKPLGGSWFSQGVCGHSLQMALMAVHIPPHLAHGFLSLLWVDSVVAPPLPFWP